MKKIIDSIKHKGFSKLKQHPNLKRILFNMGWLSFDRFFQLLVSFLVIIWVIRYLGPEQFGLLSYAGAFTGLFGAFASLGIGSVLLRDLISHPEKSNLLLGTAFYLQLFASIFAVSLCILIAYLLTPTNLFLIFLVAVCAAPFILNGFLITDLWFQSKVLSKYTVIARNAAMTITAIAKIIMILFSFSLINFAIIGFVETLLMALFLLYFYSKNKQDMLGWKFDFKVAKELLRESWPLFLSAIAMSIYLRIDQVMIGQMMSMSDVGMYSIAVKFSEFGNFIPGVLITSLLPSIILSKSSGEELFISRFKKLYGLLVLISIGIAIFLTVFAGTVVNLLYGVSYAPATIVLMIYVWSIVPMFITAALNQYFVIQKLTIFSFYVTVVGALSNIALNLFLIPQYGLIGAAVSTVVAYSLAVLSIFFFKETRKHALVILSAFNLPNSIRNLLK